MKKIKKVWLENKVLLVLAIILVICLVIVLGVSLTYFYGSSESEYGNRLDEINNLAISDLLIKDINASLKANDIVKESSVNVKGKIVYINISFVDGTKMDDAKKIADTVIPLFNEDELNVYDLEFTITSLSTADVLGYTLMGARNATGSGKIVWNNYNIEVEEVE